MARVKWEEGLSNKEMMNTCQIEDTRSPIKKQRLRWYGNVERRPPDHILRRVKELEIEGRRPKGRPQKTWLDCIKENLKEHVYQRDGPQTEKSGKISLEESDPRNLKPDLRRIYY